MTGSAMAGPKLFVISAPSGAGKTSLVRALMHDDPAIAHSVSYTTRAPRPGEVDGRDYCFVDRERFDRMAAAGEFLEHATVFDNRYGTSRAQVEGFLAAGRSVILEIDWQGARQVRAAMPGCVSVFILPPSMLELERRLRERAERERKAVLGTERAATEFERRLRDARADAAHWVEAGFVVVNDSFEQALGDLKAIVAGRGERLRADRPELAALVASLLA
jgi:guanylate kinase